MRRRSTGARRVLLDEEAADERLVDLDLVVVHSGNGHDRHASARRQGPPANFKRARVRLAAAAT